MADDVGRVQAAPPQCFVDHLQDAFQIPVDIVIPKPQNLKALALQMSITAEVANGMRAMIMLAAVNLHNRSLAQANEVDIGGAAVPALMSLYLLIGYELCGEGRQSRLPRPHRLCMAGAAGAWTPTFDRIVLRPKLV